MKELISKLLKFGQLHISFAHPYRTERSGGELWPGRVISVSILDRDLWDEWELWDGERKTAGFAFLLIIKLSHHRTNPIDPCKKRIPPVGGTRYHGL
ncbi:hypothetical protein A3860_10690 [Niastella vici]|uniref:Uncharacterized protein n=1 Tax=Niastella vici TaxID=1703345 RepID=A0A1V9FFG3_9BACT|nr:hypothetical protein A3860_10690 [Niastella vici]